MLHIVTEDEKKSNKGKSKTTYYDKDSQIASSTGDQV